MESACDQTLLGNASTDEFPFVWRDQVRQIVTGKEILPVKAMTPFFYTNGVVHQSPWVARLRATPGTHQKVHQLCRSCARLGEVIQSQ